MSFSDVADLLINAMRATAFIAGLIVAVDAIRSLAGYEPMSVGTERQRDVKWLLVAVAGAAIGGTLFFTKTLGIGHDAVTVKLLLLVGWACFTFALVFRASTRSAHGGRMLWVMLAWFTAACVVSGF